MLKPSQYHTRFLNTALFPGVFPNTSLRCFLQIFFPWLPALCKDINIFPNWEHSRREFFGQMMPVISVQCHFGLMWMIAVAVRMVPALIQFSIGFSLLLSWDHLSASADRVRALARGGTGLDFVHTLFRFVRLEIFFSFVV